MTIRKTFRKFLNPFFGLILMFSFLVSPLIAPNTYADPVQTVEPSTEVTTETDEPVDMVPVSDTAETEEEGNETEEEEEETPRTCNDVVEGVAWIVCPVIKIVTGAVDGFYSFIEENLLAVSPLTTDSDSPIYLVWQYARDITNVVFVIFLLIIIWSQLTGLGLSNYNIKKTLPRIVVAAILVNLSFIICALAVDISNIIGLSIKSFLNHIAQTASNNSNATLVIPLADLFAALFGGGAIAGIAISATGGIGKYFWMFVGVALCGLLSLGIGLITIAMRQAVIAALVMVSPLAFVCYLLPNTEKYFTKWKNTIFGMLIFYPTFALLFGAAQLAGWAIAMSSSGNLFLIIVGVAVQIMPVFMSASLMKMSHSALGSLSATFGRLTAPAQKSARGWSMSHAIQAKENHIANSRSTGAHLRRYLDYRASLRTLNTTQNANIRKGLAEIRVQRRTSMGSDAEAFDPTNTDNIKTDKYVQTTKRVMNTQSSAHIAALDAQHILSNYGKYHNKTLEDAIIIQDGMQNALELFRAERTIENDNFADTKWITDRYVEFIKKGYNDKDFEHYILGSTGSLGENGVISVLGQVLKKGSQAETERYMYADRAAKKFNYPKSGARDFYAKYFVNDNGLATTTPDENGHRELVKVNGESERWSGEFFRMHPEALTYYNRFKPGDEIDPKTGELKKLFYVDLMDDEGKKVIFRLTSDDSPEFKAFFTEHDAPIQDPISSLYPIFAGIDVGDIKHEGAINVGLSKYRTTIASALTKARFGEKNNGWGGYSAGVTSQGYIKNDVHRNIAFATNMRLTSKPANFNQQDAAAFDFWNAILATPENYNDAFFDLESLITGKDINGEQFGGLEILKDKDGHYQRDNNGHLLTEKIAADKATPQQLKNAMMASTISKSLAAAAQNMSTITPGIVANMKPGAKRSWSKLHAGITSVHNSVAGKTEEELLQKGEELDIGEAILLLDDPLDGDIIQNKFNFAGIRVSSKNNSNTGSGNSSQATSSTGSTGSPSSTTADAAMQPDNTDAMEAQSNRRTKVAQQLTQQLVTLNKNIIDYLSDTFSDQEEQNPTEENPQEENQINSLQTATKVDAFTNDLRIQHMDQLNEPAEDYNIPADIIDFLSSLNLSQNYVSQFNTRYNNLDMEQKTIGNVLNILRDLFDLR